MPETWFELTTRLIALAVLAAGLAGVVAATLFVLRGPWWPTVLYQAGQRPRSVYWPLFLSFVALTTVGFLPFGNAGLSAAALIWLFAAPRFAGWWATRRAWANDPLVTQEAARTVRNRIRERSGEPEQPEGQSWPEYIVDVARAERQAKYEPPGQEAGSPAAQSAAER